MPLSVRQTGWVLATLALAVAALWGYIFLQRPPSRPPLRATVVWVHSAGPSAVGWGEGTPWM